MCHGAPGSTRGLKVGEDEGVKCETCQKWYDATCQGVNSDAYAAPQEHSEMLALICKECKAKTKEKKGCVLNCSSIEKTKLFDENSGARIGSSERQQRNWKKNRESWENFSE